LPAEPELLGRTGAQGEQIDPDLERALLVTVARQLHGHAQYG